MRELELMRVFVIWMRRSAESAVVHMRQAQREMSVQKILSMH